MELAIERVEMTLTLVGGSRRQSEGWIPVCYQDEGITNHPIVPANHTLHEVEHATWIPAGEKDSEPRDDHDHRYIEEEKDDVMGDCQKPFDQRHPSIEITSHIG